VDFVLDMHTFLPVKSNLCAAALRWFNVVCQQRACAERLLLGSGVRLPPMRSPVYQSAEERQLPPKDHLRFGDDLREVFDEPFYADEFLRRRLVGVAEEYR